MPLVWYNKKSRIVGRTKGTINNVRYYHECDHDCHYDRDSRCDMAVPCMGVLVRVGSRAAGQVSWAAHHLLALYGIVVRATGGADARIRVGNHLRRGRRVHPDDDGCRVRVHLVGDIADATGGGLRAAAGAGAPAPAQGATGILRLNLL